jgi:Ice-binding-like/Bacterial Ig-like domain
VTTGAKSLAGISLPADFSWTFTTGATVDTTAPFVTATVPANNATSVPINAAVTVAFSEAMNPFTITPVSFTLSHGGVAVAGVVSYVGFTATFTPSSLLASSTVYTATMTAAAQDLAGNPLAFNTSWTFTTGVNLDTTAPTITATVPANGATTVPINQSVNATFSEAMNPLTVTTASLQVAGPSGALVPGIVSYALPSHIATLIPALPLASNTTYRVTVTNAAKDVAGNAFAGASWTFTTGVTPVSSLSVALGAASTFAVLGASTVTSTGATRINGDLGLSPGTSVTGFPPGVINGTLQVANSPAALAQLALTLAYNDAAGRSGGIVKAGNLGGQTLGPGVYTSSSSLAIDSGDLTLDAGGDATAVWIFQMGSTLTTTTGHNVILVNGAKAANVFWLVGSSATLGTGTTFKGNILALASITATTGAVIEGRLLARTAAVTLDTNIVTLPTP